MQCPSRFLGGGTVHFRYDAWNVRAESLRWEPNGGRGLGNRLGAPPPPPELQWIQGPAVFFGGGGLGPFFPPLIRTFEIGRSQNWAERLAGKPQF